MKILVTYPLHPRLLRAGLGDLVVYRPELAAGGIEALDLALAEHRPDVALVNGLRPTRGALTAWRESAQGSVRLIRCQEEAVSCGFDLAGIEVELVEGRPGQFSEDLTALGLAERHLMHRRAARRLAACGISSGASTSISGAQVTLVGAGIVNLMTALDLVRRGARVNVLEASPDPRSKPPWQCLGGTHGGGNARMFCFTEADNYNEKGHLVYAKMHQVFRRTIREGGWLAVEPEYLTRSERAWIERFHALPAWRAEVFTEDIHGFTVASYPLWKKLKEEASHLFDRVGYQPGILRLYAEAEKAEAAEALHARLGSLLRPLDLDELRQRHPACGDAIDAGQIARALEVRGFTLNIHDFVVRLLTHLETEGVNFSWNRRVATIERTADSLVNGLRTPEGVVRSEHYVFSPSIYGDRLLEGTRSAGKMQGIVGLWLTLPNLEPSLRHSIKLHREGHVGEDANITLAHDAAGRPTLILGSGYGYLGSQKLDMNSPEIARLFAALEETARRYFPRAYAEALQEGLIEPSRRACIRPFTATGLGLFEIAPTADGGRLIIASGHNTGGFAQAPAIAEAVATSLEGRPHSMQALYDPERGLVPDAVMDGVC